MKREPNSGQIIFPDHNSADASDIDILLADLRTNFAKYQTCQKISAIKREDGKIGDIETRNKELPSVILHKPSA